MRERKDAGHAFRDLPLRGYLELGREGPYILVKAARSARGVPALRALRLSAMAATWDEQQRHPDTMALSFHERFGLLVDAEWMTRENKRVSRSLKEAKLRIHQACVEGVDFPPRRELDKAIVRQLATRQWVKQY